MLCQAGPPMTPRFVSKFWYVVINKLRHIIVWVWPTCFWVGDRECVFSVYPRGGGAGFWDKLCPCGRESCAITHTNTLRTATRSAGQWCREAGACPQQVHTPTHSSPLFASTRCPALTPEEVGQRGLKTVHLSISRLGIWGLRSSAPSHTTGPALLYQEGSSYQIPISWPYSSVLQIWNQQPNLLLDQNQPLITAVEVFILNTPDMTQHREPH